VTDTVLQITGTLLQICHGRGNYKLCFRSQEFLCVIVGLQSA